MVWSSHRLIIIFTCVPLKNLTQFLLRILLRLIMSWFVVHHLRHINPFPIGHLIAMLIFKRVWHSDIASLINSHGISMLSDLVAIETSILAYGIISPMVYLGIRIHCQRIGSDSCVSFLSLLLELTLQVHLPVVQIALLMESVVRIMDSTISCIFHQITLLNITERLLVHLLNFGKATRLRSPMQILKVSLFKRLLNTALRQLLCLLIRPAVIFSNMCHLIATAWVNCVWRIVFLCIVHNYSIYIKWKYIL